MNVPDEGAPAGRQAFARKDVGMPAAEYQVSRLGFVARHEPIERRDWLENTLLRLVEDKRGHGFLRT